MTGCPLQLQSKTLELDRLQSASEMIRRILRVREQSEKLRKVLQQVHLPSPARPFHTPATCFHFLLPPRHMPASLCCSQLGRVTALCGACELCCGVRCGDECLNDLHTRPQHSEALQGLLGCGYVFYNLTSPCRPVQVESSEPRACIKEMTQVVCPKPRMQTACCHLWFVENAMTIGSAGFARGVTWRHARALTAGSLLARPGSPSESLPVLDTRVRAGGGLPV